MYETSFVSSFNQSVTISDNENSQKNNKSTLKSIEKPALNCVNEECDIVLLESKEIKVIKSTNKENLNCNCCEKIKNEFNFTRRYLSILPRTYKVATGIATCCSISGSIAGCCYLPISSYLAYGASFVSGALLGGVLGFAGSSFIAYKLYSNRCCQGVLAEKANENENENENDFKVIMDVVKEF